MGKAFVALTCVALTWGSIAAVAKAQFGRGGFGVGNYGRPYVGGPGIGYGGYGVGYPGAAIGGIGRPYYGNYGYGNYGYNTYRPGTFYSQPVVTAPTTNRSYYPPQAVNATVTAPTDGRARIVVQVPPNAEVWWNGSHSSTSGSTRVFNTLPLSSEGAVQKFDARWMTQNGQVATQTREVRVMPNSAVTVDFMHSAATGTAPTFQ